MLYPTLHSQASSALLQFLDWGSGDEIANANRKSSALSAMIR